MDGVVRLEMHEHDLEVRISPRSTYVTKESVTKSCEITDVFVGVGDYVGCKEDWNEVRNLPEEMEMC